MRRIVAMALVLGAACSPGKDPKTLNGTAFFVSVFFDTKLDVRALEFIGTNADGNEVFQRDTRPEPPATAPLKSPQTVRILLPDSTRNQSITLSVFGFDAFTERVEYGTALATVVEGREEDVTVNMKPFDLGTGGGAGGGTGGGAGAGAPDAGMGGSGGGGIIIVSDAGTGTGTTDAGIRCVCDGGCCYPGTSTCFVPVVATLPIGDSGLPNFMVSSVACGKSDSFCTFFCDPLRANRCDNGVCHCGDQDACGPASGMRCGESKGAFRCACDQLSQCNGCCGPTPDAGIACRGPGLGKPADVTYGACGAAGNVCVGCSGNAVVQRCVFGVFPRADQGACSSSATCLGCTTKDKCCTGMSCNTTSFPTCRSVDTSSCVPCDLLRADRCSATTGCACGLGGPCPFDKICQRYDGGTAGCTP